MRHGTVVGICVSPAAGVPMQSVTDVEAIAGQGLAGDRYARGEGSSNKGRPGKRQVLLSAGGGWNFRVIFSPLSAIA